VTLADRSTLTTLSLMEKAGVPISIVSKWAGHYDAAFTMRTCRYLACSEGLGPPTF
jgi:hypothetical protein